MIASVSIISKPSLSSDTPDAACTSSIWAMSAARRMTPNTSHSGTSSSAQSVGPAEPGAAQQPAVEPDRVGPVETDLPLGRAVGGDRVGHGIHAGEERPARRYQGFVGFEHHGEFDQIVAPHPNQRSRARIRRDFAAMGERVAKLAQRDQSIAGGQIECLFHGSEARCHWEAHP